MGAKFQEAAAKLLLLMRQAWLKKHGVPLPAPTLTAQQHAEIEECFEMLDRDGSGAIDVREIVHAFGALGFTISKDAIEELMLEADPDGSGELEFDEFLSLMGRALYHPDEHGRELVAKTGSGDLSFPDMVRAFRRKKLIESLMRGGDARLKVVEFHEKVQGLIRAETEELRQRQATHAIYEKMETVKAEREKLSKHNAPASQRAQKMKVKLQEAISRSLTAFESLYRRHQSDSDLGLEAAGVPGAYSRSASGSGSGLRSSLDEGQSPRLTCENTGLSADGWAGSPRSRTGSGVTFLTEANVSTPSPSRPGGASSAVAAGLLHALGAMRDKQRSMAAQPARFYSPDARPRLGRSSSFTSHDVIVSPQATKRVSAAVLKYFKNLEEQAKKLDQKYDDAARLNAAFIPPPPDRSDFKQLLQPTRPTSRFTMAGYATPTSSSAAAAAANSGRSGGSSRSDVTPSRKGARSTQPPLTTASSTKQLPSAANSYHHHHHHHYQQFQLQLQQQRRALLQAEESLGDPAAASGSSGGGGGGGGLPNPMLSRPLATGASIDVSRNAERDSHPVAGPSGISCSGCSAGGGSGLSVSFTLGLTATSQDLIAASPQSSAAGAGSGPGSGGGVTSSGGDTSGGGGFSSGAASPATFSAPLPTTSTQLLPPAQGSNTSRAWRQAPSFGPAGSAGAGPAFGWGAGVAPGSSLRVGGGAAGSPVLLSAASLGPAGPNGNLDLLSATLPGILSSSTNDPFAVPANTSGRDSPSLPPVHSQPHSPPQPLVGLSSSPLPSPLPPGQQTVAGLGPTAPRLAGEGSAHGLAPGTTLAFNNQESLFGPSAAHGTAAGTAALAAAGLPGVAGATQPAPPAGAAPGPMARTWAAQGRSLTETVYSSNASQPPAHPQSHPAAAGPAVSLSHAASLPATMSSAMAAAAAAAISTVVPPGLVSAGSSPTLHQRGIKPGAAAADAARYGGALSMPGSISLHGAAMSTAAAAATTANAAPSAAQKLRRHLSSSGRTNKGTNFSHGPFRPASRVMGNASGAAAAALIDGIVSVSPAPAMVTAFASPTGAAVAATAMASAADGRRTRYGKVSTRVADAVDVRADSRSSSRNGYEDELDGGPGLNGRRMGLASPPLPAVAGSSTNSSGSGSSLRFTSDGMVRVRRGPPEVGTGTSDGAAAGAAGGGDFRLPSKRMATSSLASAVEAPSADGHERASLRALDLEAILHDADAANKEAREAAGGGANGSDAVIVRAEVEAAAATASTMTTAAGRMSPVPPALPRPVPAGRPGGDSGSAGTSPRAMLPHMRRPGSAGSTAAGYDSSLQSAYAMSHTQSAPLEGAPPPPPLPVSLQPPQPQQQHYLHHLSAHTTNPHNGPSPGAYTAYPSAPVAATPAATAVSAAPPASATGSVPSLRARLTGQTSFAPRGAYMSLAAQRSSSSATSQTGRPRSPPRSGGAGDSSSSVGGGGGGGSGSAAAARPSGPVSRGPTQEPPPARPLQDRVVVTFFGQQLPRASNGAVMLPSMAPAPPVYSPLGPAHVPPPPSRGGSVQPAASTPAAPPPQPAGKPMATTAATAAAWLSTSAPGSRPDIGTASAAAAPSAPSRPPGCVGTDAGRNSNVDRFLGLGAESSSASCRALPDSGPGQMLVPPLQRKPGTPGGGAASAAPSAPALEHDAGGGLGPWEVSAGASAPPSPGWANGFVGGRAHC